MLKQDDYEQILAGYKQAHTLMNKAEVATRKSKLFAQIKQSLDTELMRVQRHILDKLLQFPANPDEQKFLIDYFNAFEVYNLNHSHLSFYSPQLDQILTKQVKTFAVFLNRIFYVILRKILWFYPSPNFETNLG